MMKSVALFDSVIVPNEDEWVVLQPSRSSSDASGSDDEANRLDDNSYDYCDDAYSVQSNGVAEIQSILADTMGRPLNLIDDIDIDTDLSVASDSADDFTPTVDDDDVVDGVDVLMQDIVETVVARQENPWLGQSSEDLPVAPTLIEGDFTDAYCAPEDSRKWDRGNLASHGDEPSTASSYRNSSGPYPSSGDDKKSSVSDGSSKVDMIADAFERQQRGTARLSNKKRRKQMKLNKKATAAAAAAAAAAALSHIPLTVPKKQKASTKGKKQVSLALQSIQSYKEEVLLSGKKNKKMVR